MFIGRNRKNTTCPAVITDSRAYDSYPLLHSDFLALYSVFICLVESVFVFQLLTTTGGVKARPSGGIVTELEDVEARMETYHMLRSFLTLIENLCETSGQPPESLGAGYRSPGFHPYLEFIISNVIMKLNSRNYKNKYEKVGLYHLVNGTSF